MQRRNLRKLAATAWIKREPPRHASLKFHLLKLRHDGITISEIIDRAMMQQSALSRVLMTMETEEYVRRVPRRDDGRYVDVFLTEKGRGLFNSLDTVVRRRQNRLLKGFSPQETDAAFAIMRRLIQNMSE